MANKKKVISDFTKMMTKEQACYMFKVDQRTVTRWQNKDVDPFPQPTMDSNIAYYDLRDVMLWKVRQEVGRLTVGDDGEVIDYEKERARLTKAQADKAEHDNARLKREVAPIDVIGHVLSDVSAQLSSILGAIIMKLKNRCPELSATQLEVIKREIVKAQNAATKIKPNIEEYID